MDKITKGGISIIAYILTGIIVAFSWAYMLKPAYIALDWITRLLFNTAFKDTGWLGFISTIILGLVFAIAFLFGVGCLCNKGLKIGFLIFKRGAKHG